MVMTKRKTIEINGKKRTILYDYCCSGEFFNVKILKFGKSYDQIFKVFINGKEYTAIRHAQYNGGGVSEHFSYKDIKVSSQKKLAELILKIEKEVD